jgi:type II secretory pathway component PulF
MPSTGLLDGVMVAATVAGPVAIDIDPRPHERAALAFEDLASALDAGLSPTSLGAPPGADGTASMEAILRARGVRPTDAEIEILAAAWDAGRAGDGLRRRALMRRQRAERIRTIGAALRYPMLLIAVSVLAAFLAGTATGKTWLGITVATIAGLVVAALIVAGIAFARGSDALLRLPMVRNVVLDLAELPYLEVLHGLYASGVPLLKAHPRAVATCRQQELRRRLDLADAVLQRNQPLGAALAESQALNNETRSLLTNGERSGDLEDALRRSLDRRSDVATRGAQRLARLVGTVVYVLAVAVVISVAFTFWSSYTANLGRLLR